MFLHAVLLLLAVLPVDCSSHEDSLDSQWKQWKIRYGKKYNDEEDYRRTIWEQNRHKIVTHNQEAELGKHSYKLGMNYLGDMTSEEVAKKMTCLNHHRANFCDFQAQYNNTIYNQEAPLDVHEESMNAVTCRKGTHKKTCSPDSKIPKSIDYRQKGMVTSVKIQGLCGSCWAFSAAGALEGQLAKKTGKLLDLSVQNLLDCVTDNKGCKGGRMTNAFMYVEENGGMNLEEDYPYVKEKQPCGFKPSAVAAKCKGFKQITEGDEHELAKALYETGPLSVAIDSRLISSYTSGVYYNTQCNKDNLTHAMLLVGYGETAEGEQYWIVKNSWGEDWGEKGYIRIARNRDNHCGIATDASYPLM